MKQLAIRGTRWGLIATYVLLVLTLQPLLLDHAFAAGSAHEHSDQDVCSWLDHAASAGVHSVAPLVLPLHAVFSSIIGFTTLVVSVEFTHDPVRGPPPLSNIS
ncbi:MAG: hypothetical protein E8D47_12750 [Nitrospira sp.]|nr:MAG: hypothetical protein E8D47_12750 [Nitrospira sp.]